jgi:hypothetical protein
LKKGTFIKKYLFLLKKSLECSQVVAIGELGVLKNEHVGKLYFNRVYNFKQ